MATKKTEPKEKRYIEYNGVFISPESTFPCRYGDPVGPGVVLGLSEISFPTMEDAKAAIDHFLDDVVPKYNGRQWILCPPPYPNKDK